MGRFSGRGDRGSPAAMASYEMGISAKTLKNGDRVPAVIPVGQWDSCQLVGHRSASNRFFSRCAADFG